MLLILLPVALILVGWVSYYTSVSVYRTLKKNDNRYARFFQFLVFIGMFALLFALAVWFVAENLAFER